MYIYSVEIGESVRGEDVYIVQVTREPYVRIYIFGKADKNIFLVWLWRSK